MDDPGAKTKAQKAAEAARELLLESQASTLRAFANALAVIGQQEEEIGELRRQVAKQQIEFYTEEEFAAKFKVCASTIARARTRGLIEPLRFGIKVRYSSLQLEQAHEIFGRKSKRPQRLKER